MAHVSHLLRLEMVGNRPVNNSYGDHYLYRQTFHTTHTGRLSVARLLIVGHIAQSRLPFWWVFICVSMLHSKLHTPLDGKNIFVNNYSVCLMSLSDNIDWFIIDHPVDPVATLYSCIYRENWIWEGKAMWITCSN